MPTKTPTRGAARKRRHRKPMSHEAMEPKNHEATEAPEDETREGTEDSEGCCNAKAGKPKCSACASGKPCSGGRGDGLTSQDYLLACDLGIQDRPTPYIRGRLDAMATRNDLRPTGGKGKKCGNSYIPASATCNNGQGGAPAKGSKLRSKLETAGMVGGAALTVGSLVNTARQYGKGNIKGAARSLYAANAGNVISGLSMRARGKRTGNKEMVEASRGTVRHALVGTGLAAAVSGDLGRAARAARSMMNRGPRRLGTTALAKPRTSMRTKAGRAAYQASYAAGRAAGSVRNTAQRARTGMASYFGRRNARRGSTTVRATSVPFGGALTRRRDSIWADGFTFDTASLA